MEAVKSLPVHHPVCRLYFIQSFEGRGYILNYLKNLIGLDSYSFLNPLDHFDTIQSFNRLPYQI